MNRSRRIKRRSLIWGLIGISLFSPGSVSAEYDPFLIPREKFRAEVKKVAIRPFRFASDVPNADFLSRLVIHHIANKVEDAGFEVVDPPEVEKLWLEYSKLLGGVYNTKTGHLDTEKESIVFEYAMRDLAARFEIDAVIRPTEFFRSTSVEQRNGYLRSSGSILEWKGGRITYSQRMSDWPQYVQSAFLGLSIRNVAGQVIYDVGCPISWTAIYMFRSFEKRALEKVYTKTSIDLATTTCVDDLVQLGTDSKASRNDRLRSSQ